MNLRARMKNQEIKPSRKHLKRKIVIDALGSFYTVGHLSKADLQFLVCALYDDLQEIKRLFGLPVVKPYGEK